MIRLNTLIIAKPNQTSSQTKLNLSKIQYQQTLLHYCILIRKLLRKFYFFVVTSTCQTFYVVFTTFIFKTKQNKTKHSMDGVLKRFSRTFRRRSTRRKSQFSDFFPLEALTNVPYFSEWALLTDPNEFETNQKIGEGATCRVYLATHTRTSTEYCLKILLDLKGLAAPQIQTEGNSIKYELIRI